MLEPAYRIIYWSLTLFLVCLVVIISLETGRPTIFSILFGISALLLAIISYQRTITFNAQNVEICQIWPIKKQKWSLHQCEWILEDNCLKITYGEKTLHCYLTKKMKHQFLDIVQQEDINIQKG